MTLSLAFSTIAAATVVVLFARRHRPLPSRLSRLICDIAEATTATTVAAGGHPHRNRLSTHSRRARFQRQALIAIGLSMLTLIGGPVMAILAISAALVQARVTDRRRRRRRVDAIAARFPDFVDLFVLTIRAGCTPVQAFRVLAATVEQPFQAVLLDVDRRVAGGDRFAEAVGQLPIGLGPIAQALADGLALADRHGTPLAPMLDRLADDARSQRRRNADSAARQLPIRLSFPLVGCTLPSFVLLTIVPLMAGTLSSIQGLHP